MLVIEINQSINQLYYIIYHNDNDNHLPLLQ